jgi:2-haloacid dehalogenase
MKKHIVFDVVGTLVSYDHLFDSIGARLGTTLQKYNISPRLLGFAWLESAEREYTYLSLSQKYVPFADVFKALFFRVLHFAGVAEPRTIATTEDVDYFMSEYRKCEVRAGAMECIRRLNAAGWVVWAFTSGDRERVKGYFEKGGVAIDSGHLVTCDEVGVGKPELKAYEKLKERIRVNETETVLWYAAAHAWDVSAAGRAGFKTAYCTLLEKEPLEEIFGTSHIVANTLPELSDKVVAAQA